MADTALTGGRLAQGRCTAEGVGLTYLLYLDFCAGRHEYGEKAAWAWMPAGGGDERRAGARSHAPARARDRPQHDGSPAPIAGRYARPFGRRYARHDPPAREAAGSPSWWRIGPLGEGRHRWSCMSSSTSSTRQGRVTAGRLMELANHLTDRDREIALALYEHRILTSSQLTLLFFSGRRRAMDRLLFLHRARVLDRFYPARPFVLGKPQAHWLLDEAGAHIAAACLGIDRRALRWRQRENWGAHPQLAHRLEVNTFVTHLIAATLPHPQLGVARWSGSADLKGEPGLERVGLVPDAGFLLCTPSGVVDCVLEWDRGTEPGSVLERKLRRYRKAAGRSRDRRRVLFVVPSARRARTIADAAAQAANAAMADDGWPVYVTGSAGPSPRSSSRSAATPPSSWTRWATRPPTSPSPSTRRRWRGATGSGSAFAPSSRARTGSQRAIRASRRSSRRRSATPPERRRPRSDGAFARWS